MRIVILGCAGSGKTTLAQQLGERTGAPVICLDSIWQPHWKEKDVPLFRALIKKAHAGDEWISDGNFALATSTSDYLGLLSCSGLTPPGCLALGVLSPGHSSGVHPIG